MFKELNKEFLTGFHAYIVQECSHRKNTTWIYMIALKHILMLARSKGYLDKDLFANYKLRTEFVSRNYLNADEINRLIELEPSHSTLRVVRDAFIFSCFTGLSYVDIHELTMKHIQHIKDQVWIMTRRAKTGTEVNVRLFSIPYEILLKYTPMTGDTPIFLLPSNGWCNQCLNQLMDMAKIDRRITFHSARHTFATTITLSQGVAIETISKLLGHRNIRTTQIYATITHARLNSEMEQLSKRLNSLYGASNVEKTGIKQRYEEMEKFDSPRKRAK